MTFVANVMNRHPALLARMAATLQDATDGRLVLGIGIGGHPAEHEAYEIPFPDTAERAARLEEAVAVTRALWAGGPVRAEPVLPAPRRLRLPGAVPPPPIIVGAEYRAKGVEVAARIGDGWTTPAATLAERLPAYVEALAASGRARSRQRVFAAFDLPRSVVVARVAPAAGAAGAGMVGSRRRRSRARSQHDGRRGPPGGGRRPPLSRPLRR